MSWILHVQQVSKCRFAQEFVWRKIMFAGRLGPLSTLHTGSTVGKDVGADVPENLIAISRNCLKGDRKKLTQNIIDRGADLNANALFSTAAEFEKCRKELHAMTQERNNMNDRNAQDIPPDVMKRALILKSETKILQEQLVMIRKKYLNLIGHLPNSTHPDVPVGDYTKNRLVYTHGPKPKYSFPVRNHLDIGKQYDIVDFESGRKVTGRNFYYLKGLAALLEMALIQYTIQKAVSKGYHPISTPDIVRGAVMHGCGFCPKTLASEVYWLQLSQMKLCLTGTAEIPLAGMLYRELLPLKKLPMRFVAFGRCFRPETGGYGNATRGLYRVHQFSKVELFAWTADETGTESEEMLQEMVGIQKEIAEELGLHYRILEMATMELGCSAYHKYDVEAWMPGRDEYGEVCSASNCTDFQSRRLSITYHNPCFNANHSLQRLKHPHSVNGTACAVPRIIIALLETYQQKDGSVLLPEVLHPFLPPNFRHLKPPKKYSTLSESQLKQ